MMINVILIPFKVLCDIGKFFIIYMPGGFGNKLRYLYYKNKFKKCGKNVTIDVGVHISSPELVSVGNNVYIDKYCIISTGKKVMGKIKRRPNKNFLGEEGEIILGDDIHIAQFCILMGYGGIQISNKCGLSTGTKLYSLTNIPNDFDDYSKVISIMPLGSPDAPYLISPIVLNENVWLAINTIVFNGVTIGENSFISNNSVVLSRVKANSYMDGQPAKRIKERFTIKEN